MNIKGWADDLLKKLGYDLNINIKKKRVYLSDAVYNPSNEHIYIYGNPASLVRTGLLYLLIHEMAHHEHMKRYGTPGDDLSESFTKIEYEIKLKAWDIFLEITEEEQ